MKRRSVYAGYILMLLIATSCNNRKYTLTIFSSAPDGKTNQEVHTISASSDSLAFARGATLYFLSLHAYRKMSTNAKPYISKPTTFNLIDETGKNVDSLLGKENADAIRNETKTLIN
jgi:hypothetical protein